MDLSMLSLAYLIALHFYQVWSKFLLRSYRRSCRYRICCFGCLFYMYIIDHSDLSCIFLGTKTFFEGESSLPLGKFFLLAYGLPLWHIPCDIGAGYISKTDIDRSVFYYWIDIGCLSNSRLSWAAESSRQQSRHSASWSI